MNNKKNIIFISLYFMSWLILLGSCLMIWYAFVYLPFPERFTIKELDDFMIQAGQKTTLMLFYVFVPLALLSLILFIIFSSFTFYLTCTRYSIFKTKKYRFLFLFLIYLTTILIPPIMFIFYMYDWIVYKKQLNPTQAKLQYSYTGNRIAKYISIGVPLAIMLPTTTVVVGVKKSNNKINLYVNKNDINNFLKVSNNNKNTLVFYFDRAMGYIWNELLQIDYLINKKDSFIEQFPEFTSYIKSLSLAYSTNMSNPSMVSGHLYSTWMNYENANSVLNENNKNYDDKTQLDFYVDGFSNLFNMLISHNVSNINISSAPYFSYGGGSAYGVYVPKIPYGTTELIDQSKNKAIKYSNNNNVKFGFTTNEAIAWDKLDYRKADRMTNAMALKNATNLMNFVPTQGNSFTWWYFGHTHTTYSWYDYETNKYLHSSKNNLFSAKDFMKSMWFSIIELKNLFLKLKSIPHKSGNGSIYDHSQILVVSDHGFTFNSNEKSLDVIIDYFSKEYNRPYLNYSSMQYLGFNSIFMFKPFSNVEKKTKFTFDETNTVTNGDIVSFIEEGLIHQKQNNNYYFDPNLEKLNNKEVEQYFKQVIVTNPYANISKLNDRNIKINYGEWIFFKNKKFNVSLTKLISKEKLKLPFHKLFES